MGNPNPAGLQLKERPSGLSPVPQSRGNGEPTPQTEVERDPLAGQAQRWDVQWLEFLDRVRSQEGLEEAGIWQEAKVLLAFLETETGACWCPRNEWAKRPGEEESLAVLPLDFQTWLGERGLQACFQAVALAEAWRQRESWRRKKQSFLQLGAIVGRGPMANPNPTGLQLKEGSSGTGDASHVLLSRRIGESPPRTGEDHFEEERWDIQWLEFLERVRSQERLEEAAIWEEAKVLLASLELETEACWCPRNEGAKRPGEEESLAVLPPAFRDWLRERGLQSSFQAVALAEAFSWRLQRSRRRENQVAAGSSSSAAQKNPLDLGRGEDGELSILELMPDCEPERDQLGKFMEEEALWSSKSLLGEEGNSTEGKTTQTTPCVSGSSQDQEKQTEEREDASPGARSSINREEGPNSSSAGTRSTEEKLFLCSACGKSFVQSYSFILHQRTHTGECPHCSKSFARTSHLRRHLRIHTREKLYPCSECGKSFLYSGRLIVHQRTHTGECPRCSQSFTDRSHLKTHLKTHTGEKPYKCPLCEKSFWQKGSLRPHQLIHTGEKPYQCSGCGMSFRQRSTLRQHQQTQHQGDQIQALHVRRASAAE